MHGAESGSLQPCAVNGQVIMREERENQKLQSEVEQFEDQVFDLSDLSNG